MDIKADYITGSINSFYNCLDVKQNCLVYGCGNQLFLYDYLQVRVHATLSAHKQTVQTCKFVSGYATPAIISADAAGQIILWESSGDTETLFSASWKQALTLKMPNSVQIVEYLPIAPGEIMVLAADTGGCLQLHHVKPGASVLVQSLKFGNHNLVECACIARISESQVLVALGGLDFQVHLYAIPLASYRQALADAEHAPAPMTYQVSLKYHENAITSIKSRRFVSSGGQCEYFLLACASKDSYVSLFKIGRQSDAKGLVFDKKSTFALGQDFYVSKESLLKGHGESVVSLAWAELSESGQAADLKPQLLHEESAVLISASIDASLIVWKKEENIWMNSYRFGQISGTKHSFFHVLASADSQYIFAYTFQGCLHVWKSLGPGLYRSVAALNGHFGYVKDIDWDSSQQFLISGSADQTTRIHMQLLSHNQNWAEISRAQVHGYDINAVKLLKIQGREDVCDVIVCGADEKVIRLYEPPPAFINYANNLGSAKLHLYFPDASQEEAYLLPHKLKKGIIEYRTETEGGAQVLGLMTKQVKIEKDKIWEYAGSEDEEADEQQGPDGKGEDQKKDLQEALDFTALPREDQLVAKTLWPELNKLYGHGYEISTVCCDHAGELIASACKSQTQEHSAIILWNPAKYQIYGKLQFHNYTVTQMEFSHDDMCLASVSRDRQFVIFRRTDKKSQDFKPVFVDKSHARIIWSVSWAHDDARLATASRDKRIKIWRYDAAEAKATAVAEKTYKQPVTAICFADKLSTDGSYVLAAGLEDGTVEILTLKQDKLTTVGAVPCNIQHAQSINRLRFRYKVQKPGQF